MLPYWNVGLSNSLNNNNTLNFVRFIAILIVGFMGSLVLFGVYLVKMFNDRGPPYFNIFIIATISLGMLWGNTPSGNVGVPGMIMALGLLIGWLVSIPSYFRAIEIFILIVCIFLSVYFVSANMFNHIIGGDKLSQIFRTESVPLNSKYLSGFVVSERTAQIFNEVPAI